MPDQQASMEIYLAELSGRSIFMEHGDKFIEKYLLSWGPGCGFGMVLNGESGFIFYTDTFNAIIIQIDMRYFYVGICFYGFGIHAKAMVLRGDLAFSR